MGFVLGKLLWSLLTPGNFLLLLLALGTARLASNRRRRGFRLVVGATLALFAIAVLPLGQWLAMPLEARFPLPALPEEVAGIIVLGGAVEPRITEAHGEVALNGGAERLVEAQALARRYPRAKLLLVGGDGALMARGEDEASLMRRLFIEQGIDAQRILIEGRSRDTFENAEFARDVAEPQPDEVWLLVTSAMHMPRAVGCFRHADWKVLPYPVDYRTESLPGPGFFLSEHLLLVDAATKEWLGLVAYRLLGHIDSLFPGP